MSKTKISEFKIGHIVYDVVLDDDLMASDRALGSCDYLHAQIALYPHQNEQRMEQVLHHEIMHAIFSEAGFDDQDEDMINRLGIVFHQFITDNFQFIGHDGIRDQIAEMIAANEEEAEVVRKSFDKQSIGFDISASSHLDEAAADESDGDSE